MADKMRVVIVDDEWIIREGIKKLVDWEKYHCVIAGEASDGAEALSLIEKEKPDILIIDINLPILSGLEAIRKLRESGKKLSVIIISGYDDFHYCQEALHMQVDDYLLKPIEYHVLEAVIQKIRMKRIQQDEKKEEWKERHDSTLVQRVTGYIQENYMREINLEKLAEEFHMSSSYISKKFKQDTGMNYYEYLTWIRLEKAKSILLNTEKSVTQAASDVGFRDYRIFIKTFKEKIGMSPKEFRKGYENETKKEKHSERN